MFANSKLNAEKVVKDPRYPITKKSFRFGFKSS